MLTIHNIDYYTTQKLILSKVSFSLLPSSLLILQGGNGSGKTTLLNIIAGLRKASSGDIFLYEENVKNHMEEYKDHICYISHKNPIKSDMQVIENIEFWATIHEGELLIQSAIAFFGLEDVLEEKCCNLSSGMQKKVDLCRLITTNKDIWLLDEPEVNLDQKSRNLLFNLINSKVQNGGIVVMASHHDIALEHKVKILMEDFIYAD